MRETRLQQPWNCGIEADPPLFLSLAFCGLRCNPTVLGRLHLHREAIRPHLRDPIWRVPGYLHFERLLHAAKPGGDVDDFWCSCLVQKIQECRRDDSKRGKIDIKHVVACFPKGR